MSTINTPEQPLVISKRASSTKLVKKTGSQSYLSTNNTIQTVLVVKPTKITYLAFKLNTPVGDGFQVPYVVIL